MPHPVIKSCFPLQKQFSKLMPPFSGITSLCWSCFFLIWATEVVSSLFSLTPLSDPPMISHSRLTELQATLNSFYLYFHWLSFLWSNVLSKTFHLNLPPIHHNVHSPYPLLQNLPVTELLHTIRRLHILSFGLGCFYIWKTPICLSRHSSNISFSVKSL